MIQKIIYKVLTNRFDAIMPELIFPNQAVFLKGRNITDTYPMVRELFGWRSKHNVEGVGVKVDFDKTFDCIHWPSLFKILNWWGFNDK